MINALYGKFDKPKITVLIAVYNAERYIAEAIRSVLNQTYQDFEIVVVDDGSKDKSINIVKSFQNSRIRIFSQNNKGPASARRLGVIKAKGRYIAILDADDIALPYRLEKQIEYLENNRSVCGIGGEAIYISANGKAIGTTQNFRPACEFAEKVASKETGFSHSTFTYLKDAVLSVGNFDERFIQSEDIDLLLRISERYDIAMLDEYVVKLRRHVQSYSHRLSDGMHFQWWWGALAAVNHYRRRDGLPDLFFPGMEDELRQLQNAFLASNYHKRRLARQQIHFGNLEIKSGRYLEAFNRYGNAFCTDLFWWHRSQASMFKGFIRPFVNCRRNDCENLQ